ncbi:MAG: family 10 glycosylhydrolase [Clostridia bacterium]|nr:family 10 glycosylhydrolase [Clostridia bacterium]
MKLRFFALLLAFAFLLAACGESGENSELSIPSKAESSTETSETVQRKDMITFGEQKYEVLGVNVEPDAEGVYIYTRDGAEAYAAEGDYTDYAVVNTAVVAIGVRPMIPANGYVVRIVGKQPAETIALGTRSTYKSAPEYIPERYVRFGDTIVEVGYKNTTRTVEVTGFVFDGGWYADSTCGNIWGLEIAVDKDGKVVTVNPSSLETSGNTPIPEDGYVLSVGAGTTLERMLRTVKVGDTAEFVEQPQVYTAKRYALGAKNEAKADSIVQYNRAYGDKTPAAERVTEVVVDKDGTVIGVYANSTGNTEIPEGGYVLVASGTAMDSPASVAKIGTKVGLESTYAFWLIENPASVAERCQNDLVAMSESYSEAEKTLTHIDFAAAKAVLQDAAATVASFGSDPTEESLLTAMEQLENARVLLIPCLTLQNREAWVTIGELNYDGSYLLHYTDEADVEYAVKFAKRMGLNTLIIDNCMFGYAAYPSEVEGMVMLPELNGFDIVGAFAHACKLEGMRLIIMVNGFSTAPASKTYPEEHFTNLYKDCLMVSKKGNTVDATGGMTLEPSEPAVQAFNLAIAKELATKYDIAGMQVDYIRYPLPIYYQVNNYEDFGYDSPVAEAFEEACGRDPKTLSITTELWGVWCSYRRDVISNYAKMFYEAVKEVDSSLEVSFTCFADYDDRQKYVYQDVEKWAENGYADAIYTMIYGSTTEYQRDYAEETAVIADYAGYRLGVGMYVRATEESIIEQLYMPYEFLSEGPSCFTLRYIATCGYDDAIRDAFRLQATPKGQGEMTTKAAFDFLRTRVEQLEFLYPDEPWLETLETQLLWAESDTDSAECLEMLLDEMEFESKTLADALAKDFAYALRFVS